MMRVLYSPITLTARLTFINFAWPHATQNVGIGMARTLHEYQSQTALRNLNTSAQ